MSKPHATVKGLEVRRLAASIFQDVLSDRVTLDEAVARQADVDRLDARDRSFLLLLLLTAFRRLGEIDAVIARHLAKPLPRKSGGAEIILRLAVCQLLFLETPAHAAIDLAVRCARADRNATHFSGLLNAVLRKIAGGGKALLEGLDAPRLNTPDWLWQRWVNSYGEDNCRAIAEIHLAEPPLDIAVKDKPDVWAERLEGILTPTGHIRLPADHPAVEALPGYREGAWWVQDVAAAIPVLLFENLSGKIALDLCAAPGGKTLQMAARGAHVVSIDISGPRLQRVRENLKRTGLSADVRRADVLALGMSGTFDAVLLDAPCSATGTIRRHPELPYIRTVRHVIELRDLQRRMMLAAAAQVKSGGRLVYCTCSLEPEEGEEQVQWFVDRHAEFALVPATCLLPKLVKPEAWVRLLPSMSLGLIKGMDGFFAAAFQRSTTL